MNRVFPGKIDGTLTEQMAFHIFAEVKRVANAMVDIHTAWSGDTRWSLFTKAGGEVGARAEAMARAFGYPVILPSIPAACSPPSCYMAAAEGRHSRPDRRSRRQGTGVHARGGHRRRRPAAHVARELGMIDEPVAPPRNKSVFISEFAWIRSTRGGLFQPSVRCGDTIKQDQVIGHYYNLFGELVAEAKSPAPRRRAQHAHRTDHGQRRDADPHRPRSARCLPRRYRPAAANALDAVTAITGGKRHRRRRQRGDRRRPGHRRRRAHRARRTGGQRADSGRRDDHRCHRLHRCCPGLMDVPRPHFDGVRPSAGCSTTIAARWAPSRSKRRPTCGRRWKPA